MDLGRLSASEFLVIALGIPQYSIASCGDLILKQIIRFLHLQMSFLDDLNLIGRVSTLESNLKVVKSDLEVVKSDVKEIKGSLKMTSMMFVASQVPVWVMIWISMNK